MVLQYWFYTNGIITSTISTIAAAPAISTISRTILGSTISAGLPLAAGLPTLAAPLLKTAEVKIEAAEPVEVEAAEPAEVKTLLPTLNALPTLGLPAINTLGLASPAVYTTGLTAPVIAAGPRFAQQALLAPAPLLANGLPATPLAPLVKVAEAEAVEEEAAAIEEA